MSWILPDIGIGIGVSGAGKSMCKNSANIRDDLKIPSGQKSIPCVREDIRPENSLVCAMNGALGWEKQIRTGRAFQWGKVLSFGRERGLKCGFGTGAGESGSCLRSH